MTPEEYLKSLIAGKKLSSISVQTSELEFLLTLMESQNSKYNASL